MLLELGSFSHPAGQQHLCLVCLSWIASFHPFARMWSVSSVNQWADGWCAALTRNRRPEIQSLHFLVQSGLSGIYAGFLNGFWLTWTGYFAAVLQPVTVKQKKAPNTLILHKSLQSLEPKGGGSLVFLGGAALFSADDTWNFSRGVAPSVCCELPAAPWIIWPLEKL